MILTTARSVATSDPEAYAWANLRKFQNVDLVEQRIVELHALKPSMRANARKQARQLRYCLIQAREYFSAAKGVSLATKPTLQYYGLMSLALAEILFKQTGNSSLDRARQHHRHHGLLFREQGAGPQSLDLVSSASSLVAAPHISPTGERRGTFELWHRSAREATLVGKTRQHFANNSLTASRIDPVFYGFDEPLKPLPETGINLLHCIRSLPGMAEHLKSQGAGASPLILRARIEKDVFPPPNARLVHRVIVHPNKLAHEFFENFRIEAGWVDRTEFRETPEVDGGIVEFTDDPINGAGRFHIPHGSSWNTEEVRFWPSDQPLNELGFLYVALFIAGNYTRYFPDKWLKDVEASAPLAVAIEELTELAEWAFLGSACANCPARASFARLDLLRQQVGVQMTDNTAEKRGKLIKFLAAIMLGLMACAEAAPVERVQIHVKDGDTIIIGDGKTKHARDDEYRLVGFDTPEVILAKCPSEYERGIRASARLIAILDSGGVIDLTEVPCSCRPWQVGPSL